MVAHRQLLEINSGNFLGLGTRNGRYKRLVCRLSWRELITTIPSPFANSAYIYLKFVCSLQHVTFSYICGYVKVTLRYVPVLFLVLEGHVTFRQYLSAVPLAVNTERRYTAVNRLIGGPGWLSRYSD
jgi:hypothetical protein